MTTLRLMAIDAICQRGSIRDSDVATLRRAFALETQLGAGDIEALFRAHNLARVKDPGWADFFIETLTDYVVRELEPSGYVTAAHAGWLIARVTSAGRIRSKTEHDLILNVIDKARWVPESLMAFALGQIRDAVITGEGPLRAGSAIGAGAITLAEVEQIRSLLFAYGNEGPRAISQTEIDILLDIEAAVSAHKSAGTVESQTSPIDAWPMEAWQDLIEKATVSAALAASGYAGPTREEALNEARALFNGGAGGTLTAEQLRGGRLSPAATAHGGLVSQYRALPVEARAMLRLELQRIEIITGEAVAVADATRLAMRLIDDRLGHGPAARVVEALAAANFALAASLAPAVVGDSRRPAFHAA